tara:strand:+ start:1674 stop:2513 length:840 start_codon:yes stop_codon:yes gene_type:complete
MYNINQLSSNSSFIIQSPKYLLEYSFNKNTDSWINILNYLNISITELSKLNLLKLLIDKHQELVIKLGSNYNILKEYRFSNDINNKTKGFVQFMFYFKCNYLQDNNICNGFIIVMPHFSLGNIGTFNWNQKNIHILHSSIKHAFLSYIQLYAIGYLHGDFHPGNVLLKKTKLKHIDYNIENIGEFKNIPTNGIRTWIMDFEKMEKIENIHDVTTLNDFYFDMKKFLVFIQQNIFITNINKTSLISFENYINTLISMNGKLLNKKNIIDILKLIDKITLQ